MAGVQGASKRLGACRLVLCRPAPLRLHACRSILAAALKCTGTRCAAQAVDLSGAGLVSRLSWLRGRGFSFGTKAADYVVAAGDETAALEFLLDTAAGPGKPHGAASELVRAAARQACRHGRLGCLQLLHGRGCLTYARVDLTYLMASASYGRPRTDVAVWLVERLTVARGRARPAAAHPVADDLFDVAARFGSLPLLQLLWERGARATAACWEDAAHGGCEAVIEYLRKQRVARPVSAACLERSCTQALPVCLPPDVTVPRAAQAPGPRVPQAVQPR
jgi:hypothetical protein